jgi:hypothetical protein
LSKAFGNEPQTNLNGVYAMHAGDGDVNSTISVLE